MPGQADWAKGRLVKPGRGGQRYTVSIGDHMSILGIGAKGSTQVLYKKRGGSSGYLGGGSFGSVHLETVDSECRDAPTIRAVKTISKRAANSSRVHWEQEIENLIVLSQHPNVFVKIYGWWEDDQSILLPMEYFEASDLSKNIDFIRDEDDIRTISQQLAVGLLHMHRLNIIHRDIKPQIGDFGFSKRVSDSVSSPFSARGTTKYMAPEYRDLMNNCETSDFTAAVDIWSFGCLIYELFARKCPFDEDNSHALVDYIYDGVFPRRPLDDCGASSESIWLIENLLKREAHLRLSAQDALHSAWLNNLSVASPWESPVQDAKAGGENDSRYLSGSTIQASPGNTLDSLSSSLGAALHHTISAPPKLVFIPPDTSISKDSGLTPGHVPFRPTLAERAITLPENLPVQVNANGATFSFHTVPIPELPPRPKSSNATIQISADDAAIPLLSISHVPDLPPRPRSSNVLGPNTLQGISDRNQLDIAISPSQVSTLGTQSMELISHPKPTARKAVPKAMSTQIFPCLKTSQTAGDYIDMASVNIKFKPQRAHGTRWVLNAPDGEFDMEIQVRVCQRKETIETSAIGMQKSMMVSAKAVPLGSIIFGARVVDSIPAGNPFEKSKASRHLPDRPVEREIKLAKEEQTITLKLGFKLSATTK
ncbi:MAG: hypothetical protein Q9186_001384 [Xanthomendoza sp. 1 TL-2023]